MIEGIGVANKYIVFYDKLSIYARLLLTESYTLKSRIER